MPSVSVWPRTIRRRDNGVEVEIGGRLTALKAKMPFRMVSAQCAKAGSGGPLHRETHYERTNVLLLAKGSLTQRHRGGKADIADHADHLVAPNTSGLAPDGAFLAQ